MTKLLLLASLAYLVYLGLESLMGRLRLPASASRPSAPPGKPEPSGDTLVRCAGCGTHVPSSRALAGGEGELFCSEGCLSRSTPTSPSPSRSRIP